MAESSSDLVAQVYGSARGTTLDQVREYRGHRETAFQVVKTVLEEVAFPGVVGGSWGRGDFHLTRGGRRSLSDLDLVLPGSTLEDRLGYVKAIEAALHRTGLPLPVSVHPSHSFQGMPLSDQFRFNLLELLIWPIDQPSDYAVSKAALMLNRQAVEETGLEAGVRAGMWTSLRLKIGIDQAFDPDDLAIEAGALVFDGFTLREWAGQRLLGLDRLAEFFDGRLHETGQWIFGHAAAKARRGLSTTLQNPAHRKRGCR